MGLNIELEEVGESFYNPLLKPMVTELLERNIAVESEGAKCVFIEKINNKKNKTPLMIQKTDGGFNYDTTDLAALRYRVNELKCDRIVYVTDVGQETHFRLVFAGGEKAEYVDPKVTRLDHMGFGLVQQKDDEGNIAKIKTRAGKSTKLVDLLDEAKARAVQRI